MHTALVRAGIAALVSVFFIGSGVTAFAAMTEFKAELKGSNEVPPNSVKGSGTLEATYDPDSKKLSWTITYSGLTAPPAAAHFHGPAPADKNAGIMVPLTGSLASPIKGSATLTDPQAQALMSGSMYINVHTPAHKAGEIRGQLMKGM